MELLHRYHVTEFVSDISFAALYPDGHENPRALPWVQFHLSNGGSSHDFSSIHSGG
ncbi:MAG: hypothetical protein QOE55_2542 [Acidobacteriaceae bacterium]|nr:hypothetical protein [Acidobacteriaceae bacterium]